tara:strand:- start:313 stop:942 length:630 start_codon:yes stop_codon:yes gene_type:complete
MSYIGSKPANKPVVGSDLDPTIITGQTAIGATPADTDELIISDAGVLKRMDYSHIKGGGKIGQVVQTVKTDRSTYGTASFADISGMSVNITPAATTSKILVMTDAFISVTSNYGAHIKLVRDSTDIYIGDAASSRSRASKGSVHYHGASGFSMSFMYLDSPSTTSATTYKLQWYPESSATIAIGGTQNDGDAVYVSRTANSITVMEVLA